MFGAPWLHPCADAFFEVRNNAVCDAGVNVLAAKAVCGVFVFGCHWFSPSLEMGCMHMQPCPSARTGVASASAGIREGNHPGCTSPASKNLFLENSAGRGS